MSSYHMIVRQPIADPAEDFKAFEYYGQAFVNEVYAHYRHPIDPGFDSRRLF